MAKEQSMPLALTITISGTAILIAMTGVAFSAYALYCGLLAAVALAAWAAALATAGGMFIIAGLFVVVVRFFSHWRRRMKQKVRHYKDPETYADRIETEIDARLSPNLVGAIAANPKSAMLVGVALGIVAGASREARQFLIRMGEDLDLTQ